MKKKNNLLKKHEKRYIHIRKEWLVLFAPIYLPVVILICLFLILIDFALNLTMLILGTIVDLILYISEKSYREKGKSIIIVPNFKGFIDTFSLFKFD